MEEQEVKRINGTPFHTYKNENERFVIGFGGAQVIAKEYKSIEEVENEIKSFGYTEAGWEIIVTTIATMVTRLLQMEMKEAINEIKELENV